MLNFKDFEFKNNCKQNIKKLENGTIIELDKSNDSNP